MSVNYIASISNQGQVRFMLYTQQLTAQVFITFLKVTQPRSQADMLIAATARIHQLTLVTRNIRDFEDCQVSILNPFTRL